MLSPVQAQRGSRMAATTPQPAAATPAGPKLQDQEAMRLTEIQGPPCPCLAYARTALDTHQRLSYMCLEVAHDESL